MPSDLTLKAMNAVHRVLIAVSFGRVGRKVGEMPVVELFTTGRRTGRERATMLTSPLQLGDALVVVASRGGDDHHPAWYFNLLANPEVRVAVAGGAPVPMRARPMTDAERAEHWPAVTARYRNYANYQTRTDRVIPLVLLEPVTGAA